MTPSKLLVAIGLATTALAACNDAGEPSAPLALAAARANPRFGASTCKPPTPDNLIPLPIAPSSERVDLYTPTFTNPTNVTNPLFPISNLSQVVLVGFVDGLPFRAETTLLPGTQLIDVGGPKVENLVSQYVAYLDRRLDETALDWYAQDDDGAVWYFGEDVANYEDGRIVDTDGTWITCKDGPMAMIMPAFPQLGDVYRVENIFPTVFEEIEITDVNQTVNGPLGPVAGAFTVQQLHLDGSYAPKIFAPGYGEFSTGSGTDIESLALAIPTDASPESTPADLRALLGGSRRVFNTAGAGDWNAAATNVNAMNAAWASYQSRIIPRLLKPLMANALSELTGAVAARNKSESRQFALDVSRTGLDLLLQFSPRIPVDFARLDLWVRQLILDTEAEDSGGAASDVAILKTILYRLVDTGDRRDEQDVKLIRAHLNASQTAVDRRSPAAVLASARKMQAILSDRIRAGED